MGKNINNFALHFFVYLNLWFIFVSKDTMQSQATLYRNVNGPDT